MSPQTFSQASQKDLMRPTVRCVWKQQTLLIVIDHAEPPSPDGAAIAAVLANRLQELATQPGRHPSMDAFISPPAMFPVRLFMRLHGQSKPYWASRLAIATEPPTDAEPKAPHPPPSAPEQPMTQPPEGIKSPPTPPPRWGGSRWLKSLLISGGCLAIALVGAGVYGLTRPCVMVEACPPIDEAQTLNHAATALLTAPQPTVKAAMNAHENLIDATEQLRRIPFWSPYHEQAQTLLGTYEQQADVVAAVVSAQRQGHEAAQASQGPPHPLTTWEDIRQTWQGAIAKLTEVPSDAMVAPLAKTKLGEYQANLTLIERRIAMEQQAQKKVQEARQAAQLAETREEVADSRETWEKVEITWQTALNRLAEVPAEAMAYAEAQQLEAIYRPRLAVASERRLHEGISEDAYSQAVQLASQAIGYERNAQWNQAVTHWQNALESAEQVPQDTSYYDQARPLINSYHTALERSQQGLRLALVLQSVREDLHRACHTPPELCSYTTTSDSLRLQIVSAYGRVIEQAIAAGRSQSNASQPSDLITRINYLLNRVAQIGTDSQVPVEFYRADGSLLGTYRPETAGFVPSQPAIAPESVSFEAADTTEASGSTPSTSAPASPSEPNAQPPTP
ncbi:MAG: hypothetical protein VKK04_23215 [Synechococcales bacterium]|nr:hypothetical protein [Synechococcales bacterium]